MDVLSDVLRAVRMTGALYFDLKFHEPWVAETPPAKLIQQRVMPNFERIILFHLVLEGEPCWAGSGRPGKHAAESGDEQQLFPGDVVICTNGVGHYMGSQRGIRDEPNVDLYYKPRDVPLPFVYHEIGGNGPSTHVACGYFGCDEKPFNPILGALPGMFIVRSKGKDGELIRHLFSVALAEAEQPRAGTESILSRLSELMFLHAVREYIDSLPEDSTGWLAGLRDPKLREALRLMHGHPTRPWTVETLASEVGMSRSAFAAHFTRCMEMPPMQYLANWRLQLASNLLDCPGVSIEQVADRVGYESPAAFNRAFKRNVGMPPGAWRRKRLSRVEGDTTR